MALYAARKRSPQVWQRIETLAEAEEVMMDPTYKAFSVDGSTDVHPILQRVKNNMVSVIYIHETKPKALQSLVRKLYALYRKLPTKQRKYLPYACVSPMP